MLETQIKNLIAAVKENTAAIQALARSARKVESGECDYPVDTVETETKGEPKSNNSNNDVTEEPATVPTAAQESISKAELQTLCVETSRNDPSLKTAIRKIIKDNGGSNINNLPESSYNSTAAAVRELAEK